MLTYARELHNAGKQVYIVANGYAEVRSMRLALVDYPTIQVDIDRSYKIDWIKLRLKDAPADTVLLIDHAVIRRIFGPLMEMFHQFDA